MGCFFACFRIKEPDQRKTHLVSNRFPSASRDPVVARRQLASVLLWGGSGSPHEESVDRSSRESGRKDGIDSEIRHEAKFLKSIGTLPETPAEIRKASEKIFVQSTIDDGLSANSSLPDTFHRKLDWNEQPVHISDPLLQVHQGSGLDKKFESCNSEEHQKSRKVMLFEGQTDDSGVGLVSRSVRDITPPHSDQIHPIGCRDSPYPTPVQLTDEMQTPRTDYPANLGSPSTRKNARTDTQYVYPVFNTMENFTQCIPDSRERIVQISSSTVPKNSRSVGFMKVPSPTDKTNENQAMEEESVPDMGSSVTLPVLTNRNQVCFNPCTPQIVVPSLSEWLKPPLPKNVIGERSPTGKSTDEDRPIIGLVAAHWNNDEAHHISQNGWDGNGIPNSTNKYKEDQKVSWHATPFEERLEKALSDETLLPQRKLLNEKSFQFGDEGEEMDTAASQSGRFEYPVQ